MQTLEKRKITIYDIPPALHAAVRALAKRNRRSMNSQLLIVLEQAADQTIAQADQQPAPTEERHDAK